MAKQTTEAIITLNGKQPLEVLNQLHAASEKIKEAMEQVQAKMKDMSPKDDGYKQLNTTLKGLKEQYNLLSSAQVKDIEATQRLQSAVENLASTSLKNLRKALGDGKRQIEGLSEAELAQADALRSMMKTVGDQVRLLEGKFVKIREGLASIGTQSDQWLSKAISQQQELMATTRRGTSEYREQEKVMAQLTAEQDRRNAAIAAEATARRQAQFKQQVASSRQMLSSDDLSKYSSSDVQTSINTLKQAQSQTAMGSSEWKQFADEIKKAEAELDKLLGKTKEVKQQMSEGEAKSILGDIGSHTEQEVREAINALKLLQSTVNVGGNEWNAYAADIEKAETELGKLTGKVKEAKAGLSMNDVNSRMQSLNDQSEQSLKEMIDYLQKAKAELTPYSQEWKNVANQIDAVKQRMADVQANTPYARNEKTAQSIARNSQLDLGNGKTHDVTRKDLQWSKDYLQKHLDVTPVADTAKIKEIKEALGLIDERMKALNGDTEKARMSADKLDDVLNNMKTASLSELRDASAELKKQLDGLAPSSDEAKKIKKQLQDLDREIKQVEDDVVDVNDVIARSKNGKASITELKQAYKQLEAELAKIETGTKDFADKRKDLEALRKKIDEVTVSAKKQGGAWKTALKNLTAYVGMFQVFNTVKTMLMDVIKKNFEYSDSLVDIRKVSGLTENQVKSLSTELAKIDTRTSVDGLAKLAFEGAKLGVGKYGVDGMYQFVAAADKINVAIGEEMGDEALPALLKMTEVMGLIPKMGLEKAIEATGSAMFKLSSSTTATSNDIVEFAKRCTGVARTAGITTDQLLALGSAFSAQMASPEVAATAMSKFIVALQTNHNLIEKDLSIPPGTIDSMYRAGHAMDAIVLILEKMKAKGNMNALGEIFKDVGGNGQRLISSMVTMAKNVDMLKDHLYDSEEAFREATAVSNEYAMQQQSAIGILERANNLWSKAFVNSDGVDAVKDFAEAWYDVSTIITESPWLKGVLSASLTIILNLLKGIAYLLPILISYVAGQGIYMAFAGVVRYCSALKAAWVSMVALTTATRTAAVAQTGLNTAMKGNPYVAVLSLLISIVGAVWAFADSLKSANEEQTIAEKNAESLKKSLGEAAIETKNLTSKMKDYIAQLDEANVSREQQQRLVRRFNKEFRPYITNLGIEIKTVGDLKNAYSRLAQEAQRATYHRFREETLNGVEKRHRGPLVDAMRRIREAMKPLQEKGLSMSADEIMTYIDNNPKLDGDAAYKHVLDRFFGNKGNLLYVGKYGGYKVKIGGKEISNGPNEQKWITPLLSALRYYHNERARRSNDLAGVYSDYSHYVPKNYTPFQEDEMGGLDEKAEDKDATKAAKATARQRAKEAREARQQAAREERERKQKIREELRQLQDEAKAFVNNVDTYYSRQKNAATEWGLSRGYSEEEMALFLESLRLRGNDASRDARLAVSGKLDEGKWSEISVNLRRDIYEDSDETGFNLSEDLLESIQSVDVGKLYAEIERLSNELKIPVSASISSILKEVTKEQQAELSYRAKKQEEQRKSALERNYVGAVQQKAYDDFTLMGYDYRESDDYRVARLMKERKDNIVAMYENARKKITSLYRIDVSSEEDRGLLMKLLFGNESEDELAERIKESLGSEEENWRAFYSKLIQYSDEYTEAVKKEYEVQKKIVDQMWATEKRNLGNQAKLRKMQNEAALFGKRDTFWSNLGLAEPAADPEVELMKARMQAAEDYYAFVEAHTKNQQLRDEAERARQEAELNYANQMATAMKNRLSQMKELVQPITDFGAAVGQALADMRNDADKANDAIKSALKSMLETWGKMALNDVNMQMWKAINDAAAKKGVEKAQVGIEAARANASADSVKEDLSDLGTANNPIYAYVVNANENPASVPLTPTGDIVTNPDGSKGLPPRQEESGGVSPHVNPLGYQDQSSVVFKDAASQTGAALSDAATGNGSLDGYVAGVLEVGSDAVMNANFSGRKSEDKDHKRGDKERKRAVREERKHQRTLTKETRKGTAERERVVEKGAKRMAAATEEGNTEQRKSTELAQNASVAAIDAGLNTVFTLRRENDKEELQAEAETAETQMSFSIAGAIGKCYQFLGPIAGPIAAAVVMSTLTGLMQWALSSAFSKSKDSSSKSTKLVSGMLTYDSGNVQDLKPFVGDNGEIYWATEQNNPQSGVNLLTQPTATTINGQRALVAENGPELVIGRETTQAMMMNNPSLLKALVNYDSNYSGRNAARRTFDEGNVGEAVGNFASGASATDAVITASTASNAALLQAVNALLVRLNEPISAKIDMYGRGNLYDSMTKANQFMKGKA